MTGRIPEKIGDLGSVESIDFSSNQLSSQIPQSMSSLIFLSQFFFLISKKNILKKPQENIRPTKEYREGHKQREKQKRKQQKTNGANQN